MKKIWIVLLLLFFVSHCIKIHSADCVNTSCSDDKYGKLDNQNISWNPVLNVDLEGYRIFRCSSLSEATCVICKDVGNVTSYTLTTANCLYADRETFIRIKAYDTGGLESTSFSNPVQFDMSGWSCLKHLRVCQIDPSLPYDCPECEYSCFPGDLYEYTMKFTPCP